MIVKTFKKKWLPEGLAIASRPTESGGNTFSLIWDSGEFPRPVCGITDQPLRDIKRIAVTAGRINRRNPRVWIGDAVKAAMQLTGQRDDPWREERAEERKMWREEDARHRKYQGDIEPVVLNEATLTSLRNVDWLQFED